MSINLTQKFVFETDSLESLKTMLKALVPIVFKKQSGLYTSLHLKTQKPSSFDDGSYDHYWDHRQSVVTESPEKHHLLKPNRTYNGTTVYSVEKTFKTLDDATQASYTAFQAVPKPKPDCFWITTLADYRGDGLKKEDVKCRTYDALVEQALLQVTEAKTGPFREACGDGYNSWFNHDDGSIHAGYRIKHRPNGGWNELDVSLIHIYYGK